MSDSVGRALQRARTRNQRADQERASARDELAKAIRAADKADMPKVAIAQLAGVSRQTVHNILNR